MQLPGNGQAQHGLAPRAARQTPARPHCAWRPFTRQAPTPQRWLLPPSRWPQYAASVCSSDDTVSSMPSCDCNHMSMPTRQAVQLPKGEACGD